MSAWLWQPFLPSAPAAAVDEPWIQPVQGTQSLARAAAQFRTAAVQASQLGWHESEQDGPVGDQPSTWTQEVPGASSRLAVVPRQWWQRVATTQSLRQQPPQDFSFVVEPEPGLSPVPGVDVLARLQREQWRRAATTQGYRTACVQDESVIEESTWLQAVAGTTFLRQQQLLLWRRAVAATMLGQHAAWDSTAVVVTGTTSMHIKVGVIDGATGREYHATVGGLGGAFA